MTVFRKALRFCRRSAWLAAFLAVFATVWVTADHAQTQIAPFERAVATVPYSLFQDATLTGSGNTITATWLPVVTASGATIHKNVTLQFNVDALGNLTVTAGYPKVVPSPAPLVSSFEAGNYQGPSSVLSGDALITVSGPGVTTGGATEWSSATSSGASTCTYPSSAAWYVGPIASNPFATRISAAQIPAATVAAYSWGVTGNNECGGIDYYYGPNALIALSQTNGTLTIVSFSYNGTDYSTPQSQITYTLKTQ